MPEMGIILLAIRKNEAAMTTLAIPSSALLSPPRSSDDDIFYEIVDGCRLELPPMGLRASRMTTWLGRKLGNYAESQDLGEAAIETLFNLPLPVDRNRRPDVALVSYSRWPKGRGSQGRDDAWVVAPNLVVEVVSPNDLADGLLEKIEEYFQANVQLVWVIYPNRRVVHVFESFTQIRGLTESDELDGGSVLPGFRVALTALFQIQ